jgi:hypothetical protein
MITVYLDGGVCMLAAGADASAAAGMLHMGCCYFHELSERQVRRGMQQTQPGNLI